VNHKPSALRGVLQWLRRQLFPIWMIVWLNGVVLRLTIRDSAELLAPLYYATPWPVLAILTLPLIAVVWRKPKMVLGVIVIAHLFAAAWIMESWRTNDPATGPADLKIIQWNVDRPIRRMHGTMERVREFDADIFAISEPMPEEEKVPASRMDELKDAWRRGFPDYQSVFADGNLLLLVRGEVTSERHGELGAGSFYSIYDLKVKGRSMRLLQADIYAKPTNSRRIPLDALTPIADSLQDQPLIITGDFNTPRDSVFLEPLRKHHRQAWEVAGTGGSDTWPWPLPVLSLDQVWSNDLLKPLRCRTAGNWRSDHLWVEAEFVFER
jgi:endonuclease/exonuclease/phosphatase family metal-dependent hydrolase